MLALTTCRKKHLKTFTVGILSRTSVLHPGVDGFKAGMTNLGYIEGETITYLRKDYAGEPEYYKMLTNSYSMSGTTPGSRRYMKLYVYMPVALHQAPRKALLISYGVGSTAKALTDMEELRQIDIVDISREILEMSDLVYGDSPEHPLRDPRVQVHVEDGRYFLQTSSSQYDIITGEPPPPKVAGVVDLAVLHGDVRAADGEPGAGALVVVAARVHAKVAVHVHRAQGHPVGVDLDGRALVSGGAGRCVSGGVRYLPARQ